MSKNAVCYTVIVICLFTAACFAKYSGGSGTAEAPYLIATPNDLNSIGTDPNDWDKQFLMTADINWLEIGGPPANKIGEYIPSQPSTGIPFSGVFDGNENQILNWCDSNDMSPCMSLFGRVAGPNAVVKNLRLVDSRTNGPALVKYLEAVVDNCRVESGNVFGEGGLVGDNFGAIRRSHSNVTIQGNQPGALVRSNFGSISNCSASSNVVGNYCVGGLVAWSGGSVEDSYAVCTVDGNNAVGGLVGMNKGDVLRCFTNGIVIGQHSVGGLTGDNHPGKNISDSYSLCVVSGDEAVGGITGYNMGIILRSYATAKVDGNDFVGAFVGRNGYQPSYWKCFWDTNANTDVNGIGNASDPNVIGLPTGQMQRRSTFADAGWDMINIWDIGEHQTYPFLRTHLPSDINKDEETNLLDLAILAERWLDEK